MSNWQQTCEQQRNRLENTEVLVDKLLTLFSKRRNIYLLKFCRQFAPNAHV
jgi:hypothetical protein